MAQRRTRSLDGLSLQAKGSPDDDYSSVLAEISELISEGRRSAARAVNAAMTTTYWRIGQRIVEAEQQGAARAGYGEELIKRLSHDLVQRAGRGFGARNLAHMWRFFLDYPHGATSRAIHAPTAKPGDDILQTLSAKSPKPLKSHKSFAEYALEGLPNKVMAAEYRTTLPSADVLMAHIENVRVQLIARSKVKT